MKTYTHQYLLLIEAIVKGFYQFIFNGSENTDSEEQVSLEVEK